LFWPSVHAIFKSFVTEFAVPPLSNGSPAKYIDPFTVIGEDVYCVIDPDAPDHAILEASVRLARLLALASLRERAVEIDAIAVATALRGIREVMDSTRALKARLTSISTATKDVWTGLDALQANVLQKVSLAEQELRITR